MMGGSGRAHQNGSNFPGYPIGQRGDLFHNYSREGSRGQERAMAGNVHHGGQGQKMPSVKQLQRLPQHRATNLSNVMECIREEEPHL